MYECMICTCVSFFVFKTVAGGIVEKKPWCNDIERERERVKERVIKSISDVN